MSRLRITEELVRTTAEAIMAEGATPALVAVRERIGGGSYTTVKKFLDAWFAKRAAADGARPELPESVEKKGREFVIAVWALSKQIASQDTQAAKDAAAAEVAAVQEELTSAIQEIARLEASEAKHAEIISQQETKIRELELGLADAQAQARRTMELEKALSDARSETAAAHKEASAKAVDAGRLTGETEALRNQVAGLMEAIKSIGKRE
ncbi:MAG TPA: DNA-binding protein [Fibrobacteria bacterium]|nr:DNA-binding protein [Fibrobacteria bacterium]